MTVALHDVSKRFGEVSALAGVDVVAGEGELLVIIGPSGSGKSTLLRCVAGLERPDSGRVEVGGRDVTASSPGDRDVAMVFQEYALFPHLSVTDNISFGLRARREPSAEVERRTAYAMGLLGLTECKARRPAELSGGERQRVALARAIVREPKAFLMDEPLANLDAELRTHTRAEIRALQRKLGTSTIYVTHDQTEAFALGDRIAVLRGGRVAQVATPRDLYESPADTFVARFVGSPPMNVIPGSTLGAAPPWVGIRPHRLVLVAADGGRVDGSVTGVEPLGSHAIVHVDVGGHSVSVYDEGWTGVATGARVGLGYSDADLYPFDESGRAVR